MGYFVDEPKAMEAPTCIFDAVTELDFVALGIGGFKGHSVRVSSLRAQGFLVGCVVI